MRLEFDDQDKKERRIRGLILGSWLVLFLMVAVLAGSKLYTGFKAKQLAKEAAENEEETVLNSQALAKMKSVEELIQTYYYLDETETERLEEGVFDGMMGALEDPYSVYYTQEELQEQLADNEGVFFGIGAYISIDKVSGFPFVSGLIEGAPAEGAGLRPDDVIYQVDGVDTYGMTLNDVVSIVRGEEGSTVTLNIIRGNENFDVDVVRAKVTSETAKGEMLEDDIGYIQISEFADVTVDQFTEAYAVLKGKGAKALILDLRGNPGGLLSAAVDISRQILPEGLIVYTEDKQGKREEYTCDGTRKIEIPMVVLVNGGSASAAEIVTGAIKDHGVGTVMGTTTYGKGIVQKIYSLSDGSAIKLTVSAYYTPNGTNIHETGIEPDVEVLFDAEAYYAEESVDNQLEAAKEYLKKQMK
ncbi:MAG: S41 family peptidase [Lachnospiraceae bacterium]|nr:S41 family peptidase [Lachnospiraceae bacterium]